MLEPEMTTNDCGGYHWSQGQYVVSSCSSDSSTFFMVLGFTMLVLVLIIFIIVVIACVRRQRLRSRPPPSPPMASQENEDDCVINLDGLGPIRGSSNGRDMENVKCVIMAGEDKPTFIAHPVLPTSPSSSDNQPLEEADRQEMNPDRQDMHMDGQVVNPYGQLSGQAVIHAQDVS